LQVCTNRSVSAALRVVIGHAVLPGQFIGLPVLRESPLILPQIVEVLAMA